jgi:SAM-dependent methyltransferase
VSSDRYTDRTVLATEAYSDSTQLRTRYSIYTYRRPPLDLPKLAADLLHDAAGPVLDVGCGPGVHTAALRADRPQGTVIAADLSPGMAREAGAPSVIADAAALPVATGSCGGVLAMHMLYHVPDPEAAVRETKRVMAPGGTVLVSTNAGDDKEDLYAVCRVATADLAVAPNWDRQALHLFHLDEAEAMLRRHFTDVRRIDLHGVVEVPDPEPVVAFIASTSAWYPGAGHDEVLDRIRDTVAEVIEMDGAFRFRTHVGVLVCR